MTQKIHNVGVVGCGLMGSGIAELTARSGYTVVVRETNQELLAKALARIDKSLGRAVERGKLRAEERDATRGQLRGTIVLHDFTECDLVMRRPRSTWRSKRRRLPSWMRSVHRTRF